MFDSCHILVYDEDVFLGKILENVLESFGVMRVTLTNDKEEAKLLLEKMQFSAIFMDWQGYQDPSLDLLSHVRLHKGVVNARIPVVVVTAHTAMHRVLHARDLGATEVLAKPIAPAHVFDKLYSALYNERDFIEIEEYTGPDRRRSKDESYQGYDRRKELSLAQDQIDRVMNDGG